MSLSEMRDAVALQRTYWGDDPESVVPAHMLFTLAQHGGHVLAAFDGDRMVGILIGLLGTSSEDNTRPAMADLQIVSKRMLVLPEYRGAGVGYKLKKRQRDLAMRQGVRLITWTFDPLMAANAYLNIHKLGGISNVYLQDYYGTASEGGLTLLGSSDRLVVDWWVTYRRVEERLSGSRGDLRLSQYLEAQTPILNPTTEREDGLLLPATNLVESATSSLALVEIPVDFNGIVRVDEGLAREWRLHLRHLLPLLFEQGYVATDFVRDQHEGRDRAFYLLSDGERAFERIDFSRN